MAMGAYETTYSDKLLATPVADPIPDSELSSPDEASEPEADAADLNHTLDDSHIASRDVDASGGGRGGGGDGGWLARVGRWIEREVDERRCVGACATRTEVCMELSVEEWAI